MNKSRAAYFQYLTDQQSTNDYYPFGSQLPNRGFDAGSYKFGFNGKENDDEVYGDGNFQDYGMRYYDTRVGRFVSVDPITKDYPELTPYQFASNSPASSIDIDGLEGCMTSKLNEAELNLLGYNRSYATTPRERAVLTDAVTIVGGTVFTIVGGPAGWIYGPSTVGLGIVKLVGHCSSSANQDKVNKVNTTFTGVLTYTITMAATGDDEKASLFGNYGDLYQDAALLGASATSAATSAKDLSTGKLIDVANSVVSAANSANSAANSSSPSTGPINASGTKVKTKEDASSSSTTTSTGSYTLDYLNSSDSKQPY